MNIRAYHFRTQGLEAVEMIKIYCRQFEDELKKNFRSERKRDLDVVECTKIVPVKKNHEGEGSVASKVKDKGDDGFEELAEPLSGICACTNLLP
jgi:hypothetical protein